MQAAVMTRTTITWKVEAAFVAFALAVLAAWSLAIAGDGRSSDGRAAQHTKSTNPSEVSPSRLPALEIYQTPFPSY
jgi:hypothetical protein